MAFVMRKDWCSVGSRRVAMTAQPSDIGCQHVAVTCGARRGMPALPTNNVLFHHQFFYSL